MKKIITSILFIILIIALSVVTTLWITEKNKNNLNQNTTTSTSTSETTTTTKINDEIKLIDTSKNGEIITQKYQLRLNGIVNTFNISYNRKKDTLLKNTITGTLNNNEIFFINYENEDLFTIESINNLFNTDNFKFIKGTDDKNYLSVLSSIKANCIEYSLLVLNDNYQEIIRLEITRTSDIVTKIDNDKLSKGYSNTFNIKSDEIENDTFFHLTIDDNKIYFLHTNFNEESEFENENYGTVEERIYTINNDKMTYTKINTYKILGCANMS